MFKPLLPSYTKATYPAHQNLLDLITLDYIRGVVQIMKFLIVKPFPLPILISFASKHSPKDPVLKCSYFAFVEKCFTAYNAVGKVIVLCISFIILREKSITCIFCFKSTFYFLVNRILICD